MSMTITTWNVQNFRRTDLVFSDKLDFLVGILQALGSDVVALQEILDLNALQDLSNRLGFHHFAAAPDDRGNRVAFSPARLPWCRPNRSTSFGSRQASRFVTSAAMGRSKSFQVSPGPAFQITVGPGGGQIDIVTAHLKSKLLTFGANLSTTNETLRAHTAYFALERRAAEATSLREHVTSLLSGGRQVVVLGDLNDGPEAATTEIFYGPPGGQPHGPEDATHASGAFQRADAQDGQRLFNVTKLVPGTSAGRGGTTDKTSSSITS